MKTKLLLLVFISVASLAYGQDKDLQVISSASNSFETGNLSLEWTLGEVVIDYLDDASSILSQGFHQPAYQLVADHSIPVELGLVTVFPNPFSDELFVKMSFADNEEGTIELLDIKGTSLWKKPFAGKEVAERYTAAALPSGTYLLVVSFAHETILQSYQLIKPQ